MLPGVRVALACLALAVVAPASASALTLKADRPETGWIRLSVPDAGNASSVALAEQVGAAQQPIAQSAPSGGSLVVRHAVPWACDRLQRSFVATATYPDGTSATATASVGTPSCAKRFALEVRKLRGRLRVHVTDRWKLGGTAARACVRAPGHRTSCRSLAIAHGARSARRDFRARASGVWRVAVGGSSRTVYVRPRGRLRLLATGDSMIQIIDSDLKNRLAGHGIGVRSDARISTGLSKPFLLNWPNHAKQQARGIRPDVTVVFIGANDGFPIGGVDCCGDKWVDAYAKRVAAMMRSYSRGGRGLVYWLTLPAPRPAQWKPIYPAVNRAVKRAAAAAASGGAARVLDIAKTFTPGYRFRQSMTWHGRRESVRQPDGVHLSPAGAAIAETLIERALRRDGAL